MVKSILLSTMAFGLSLQSALALSTSSTPVNHVYDLVVVGGGSAGLTAAKLAGGTLGNSVVIIEENKLGGDCTWTGCVPSKSLLASAKAAFISRRQAIQSTAVDFRDVKASFRRNQQEIYEEDDSPAALERFNVETMTGRAVLSSPTTLTVKKKEGDITVRAKEGIILCTGASPTTPSIPGLQDVNYLTYEDVWEMEELPKRMTVVGGGPIGCELAQAFCRLGSNVTIIASKLLPNEEPRVGKILREVFLEEGITVVEGRMQAVRRINANGGHEAIISNGAKVDGDTLLVSVGRSPNIANIGLDLVGINVNGRGGISVNDKLQTSCKGIYAAGDCTGDRQFTHYAGFQGAIAARNILLPLSDPGILQTIPAATFTSPEIASVGYTEAKAIEELGKSKVAISEINLSKVDRAVCDGQTKGFIKVVHHKKNGQILGATIMAPSAGELISEISIAMTAKIPFANLAKVIHPYPSYAIAIQIMAAEVYYEKTMKLKWLYDILKQFGL